MRTLDVVENDFSIKKVADISRGLVTFCCKSEFTLGSKFLHHMLS